MSDSDQQGVHIATLPDEDSDSSGTYVSAGITNGHGDHHTASIVLQGEPADDEIAAALLKTALAAAQMHSSGAWIALQQRLAGGTR